MNTTETPDFERARTNPAASRGMPLLDLLRNHPRNVFLAMGARLAETISSNIINAFGLAYVATQLAMDRAMPLTGVLIASAIGIFMCPVFGILGDRIGKRAVYVLGTAFMTLFAFPFFILLATKSALLILIATVAAYNLGPTMMFAV